VVQSVKPALLFLSRISRAISQLASFLHGFCIRSRRNCLLRKDLELCSQISGILRCSKKALYNILEYRNCETVDYFMVINFIM